MAEASIGTLREKITQHLNAGHGKERAPNGFDNALRSVCKKETPNEFELLTLSIYAWTAFFIASQSSPTLRVNLEKLTSKELHALFCELPRPHEEFKESVKNTFHEGRIARDRCSLLESVGLSSIIPENPAPRPSKRQRTAGQPQQSRSSSDSVEIDRLQFRCPSVTSLQPAHLNNMTAASSLVKQPQSGASPKNSNLEQQNDSDLVSGVNAVGQNAYWNVESWNGSEEVKRGLSLSQNLSRVFYPRCIDDIIVTSDHRASIRFEYGFNPRSNKLQIEISKNAVIRLATILFNETIEYSEKRRCWVKKLNSGVNFYCNWFLLEGANKEAAREYLGHAVELQMRSSSIYQTEELGGQTKITEHITLEAEANDSSGILKVNMGLDQLTILEALLTSLPT